MILKTEECSCKTTCVTLRDVFSLSRPTLQILLYNQQYVYDDDKNDSVSSVTVTSAVTIKITSYETYVAAHSVVAESVLAIVTAFHELLSAIHDGIIPAVTIMTAGVKIMTNNTNATVYFAFIDAEFSVDNTNSSAIIIMTTAFHESPSAIHHNIPLAVNDRTPSAAIADKA